MVNTIKNERKVQVRSKINMASVFSLMLLLSIYTCFYMIHLPRHISTPSYMGITINISLVGIIVLGISKNFKDKIFEFDNYIIYYILILALEFFITCNNYPNISYVDIFKYIYSYLMIICYFVFSIYAQQDLRRFLKLIIYCADFAIIVILLQAIVYNLSGIFFLNRAYFSDLSSFISTRSFGIRLIGSYLIDFTAIISIGLIFSKEKYVPKNILISNIFLTFLYQILSAQTRSMQLILGLVILISFQFFNYKNSVIKIIIRIITTIIIVYICFQFLNEINGSIMSRNDWSYYHRLDEMNFLWSAFKNHPILGNGLIDENTLTSVYGVNNLNGMNFNLYYSDVGVIGLLAQEGILGLSLYIWPLIYLLKKAIVDLKNRAVYIAMFVGILASMLNLSLFDNPRLMILPIYFAVLDGITVLGRKNSKY